ncbi:tyrosine--tRNA ligase [Candidatus Pacearchaeota archaeon]|nr:MAG: tyrosine--tRNA ligase [Candidatus Pacearchaeota archaeon]
MDKFELIKRNVQEIIGEEDLKKFLKENKKLTVYWGTAPTGKPHVGYFLPMLKIADLLNAGFKVKILLADLHASLDNTPWDILDKRYKYYSEVIPLMVKSIGADIKNLEFVRGRDFQLKSDYFFDLLKLSTLVSVRASTKAASEVIKNIEGEKAKLSGLIYPLMQVLDEEYLKVDCQLGGTDQRKIMVLAREFLPKIGYKQRIEILNPLIPGLIGKKMSASDEKSKVDLLDSEKEIQNKIKNAEMIAGNPDNGVMAFLKYVIMTIKKDKKEKFIVKRPEKFGGDLEYKNYEDIEKDFINKKLHPLDLKNAVAKEIFNLLKEIQKKKSKLQKIAKEAYQ